MTVPTLITELSTTAASNPPAGSETAAEGDNHLRAAYAFIAQNYANKANLASPTFTGTVTADVLTTTGNTTLGNASTDTLNVGNGGLVKDSSGNVGIGTSSPSGRVEINDTSSTTLRLTCQTNNAYRGVFFSGVAGTSTELGSIKYNLTAQETHVTSDGSIMFDTASTERLRIDSSGNVISHVEASAPALTINQQMVFALTSNTNLQISVRGTDGTTRTANITLA
jgi:hypothetical protein